jgi:hypothetical protein
MPSKPIHGVFVGMKLLEKSLMNVDLALRRRFSKVNRGAYPHLLCSPRRIRASEKDVTYSGTGLSYRPRPRVF